MVRFLVVRDWPWSLSLQGIENGDRPPRKLTFQVDRDDDSLAYVESTSSSFFVKQPCVRELFRTLGQNRLSKRQLHEITRYLRVSDMIPQNPCGVAARTCS